MKGGSSRRPFHHTYWKYHQRTPEEDKLYSDSLQRLAEIRGKPFWIEDPIAHEQHYWFTGEKCCFNHIIGLPQKDGEYKVIFDYEIEIVKYLDKYKHLWIKKARGLGVTELLLRYMGWLALFNDEFYGNRFIVVTGPKERIALDLIRRVRHMFQDYLLQDPLKETVVLNGVTIEAFPSHTVAMRGYENFKFILLDEADYFRPNEQEELLPAVRGFVAKTDPWIVMVSTPHEPGSLFHRIEQMKSDEEAGFKRIQYLYERGLGKIYEPTFIEAEKGQDYFKREYEGQYAFGVGTLFSESSILNCERFGRETDTKLAGYSHTIRDATRKSLGIDIGWGSSRTALVLTEWVEGKVSIRYVEQFDRADFESVVRHTYNIIREYDLDNGTNKIFIDGSAPSFISSLKSIVGEDRDYPRLVKLAKQTETELYYMMNIVPINFTQRNQAMLDNSKRIMDKGLLAINPDTSQGHRDLLTDLRIAKNKPDTFKLDKAGENKMDLFDALRLALEYYK